MLLRKTALTSLKEISWIMSDNLHSKAHLIKLAQFGYKPSFVLIIEKPTCRNIVKKFWPEWVKKPSRANLNKDELQLSQTYFKCDLVSKKLITLLKDYKIEHKCVFSQKMTSEKVIKEILKIPSKYVVYNADGILNNKHFNTGKIFINCHKGILPDFRGSSATNWSILSNGKYGVTVHFMDSGIDTGPIIRKKHFSRVKLKSLNEIRLFEASMVSETLFEVLLKINKDKDVEIEEQSVDEGSTFYVIHPYLAAISYRLLLSGKYEDNDYGHFKVDAYPPNVKIPTPCTQEHIENYLQNFSDMNQFLILAKIVEMVWLSLRSSSTSKIKGIFDSLEESYKIKIFWSFIKSAGDSKNLVVLNTALKALDLIENEYGRDVLRSEKQKYNQIVKEILNDFYHC